MSVPTVISRIVLDAAMAALHEVLDREIRPGEKANYLDAAAERARFDADGQRKQDARDRQR